MNIVCVIPELHFQVMTFCSKLGRLDYLSMHSKLQPIQSHVHVLHTNAGLNTTQCWVNIGQNTCWVVFNQQLGYMFNPTFWAVTQPLGLNNPVAGFAHILPSAGLYFVLHILWNRFYLKYIIPPYYFFECTHTLTCKNIYMSYNRF